MTTFKYLSSLLFIFCFISGQAQDYTKREITRTTNSVDYVGNMDVDGDGDQDIVFSKGELLSSVPADEAIQWIENIDNEGFGQTHNLVEGHWGHFLVVDLDADDDHDLIYSTYYDGTFLLINNGGLDFQQELLSSNYYKKLILHDVNQDGNDDLVSLSESPGGFWVSYADGLGSYLTAELLYDPSEEVTDILFMDYNQDGDEDIIALTESKIVKRMNDGSNNFIDDGLIINTNNASFLGSVDRNLDDIPDLMWGIGQNLRIYDNDGLGNFEFGEGESQVGGYSNVELADLNGDGELDIITGGVNMVWYEPGLNAFNLYSEEEEWYNQNVSDILVADINGDGNMDIVVASETENRLNYFEHSSSGNGTFEEHNLTTRLEDFQKVFIADMNNDNRNDVIYFSENQETAFDTPYIHFALMSENGEVEEQVQELYTYSSSLDMIIADLCGNGFNEAIISNYNSLVAYGINNNCSINYDLGPNLEHVMAIDYDQDGDMDILAEDYSEGTIHFWMNVLNNFVDEGAILDGSMDLTSSSDLDGDGIEDAIFRTSQYQLVYIPSEELPLASTNIIDMNSGVAATLDYEVNDADNDGDLDVVTLHFGNQIVLHINDGEGNFAPLSITDPQTFAFNTGHIEFVDFDGDSYPDILYAKTNVDAVLIKRNLGNLEFANEEIVLSDLAEPKDLFVGLIDDNEQMDILVSSSTHKHLFLYENSEVYGCMDNTACNYNPEATLDNDSCVYGTAGCMDPASFLFDPEASCDDGSCLFQLNGLVYNDSNENTEYDDVENGIAGIEVQIEPTGISAFSDLTGAFNISLPDGTYTLTAISNAAYPYLTTDENITIEIGNGALMTPAEFGLIADLPSYVVNGSILTNPDLPACENFLDVTVAFTNQGNEAFEGVLALEVDNDFQNYVELDEIDSVDGNTYYFSFENLQPGESMGLSIQLLFPNVDFIGSYFFLDATIYRQDEENLVEMNSFFHEEILNCAYDPNDKTVYPAGVGTEGYILNETNLEYRVRFQNTGSAPAVDVVILDEMDENLDLNSLSLVANSHPVMVSVDEFTREVQFLFDNILLPDSLTDEENSHGYVIFRIDPLSDLDVSTEITNTAGIYFDSNEPIITNTVLNTIYECSLFNPVLEQNGTVLTVTEGSTVEWLLNGEPFAGSDSLSVEISENGLYTAVVGNEFDCENSLDISVTSLSISEFNAEPILIYPNPASTELFIELKSSEQISVMIKDELGRDVSLPVQRQNGQLLINIGSLSSGMYYLHILDELGNVGIEKFVKR